MDWRAEITAGEPIAKMIMNYFYSDSNPSAVSLKAASLLAKLKHEARRYWPELSEVQRLKKLASFGKEDFVEALSLPDTRPAPKKGSIAAMLPVPEIP